MTARLQQYTVKLEQLARDSGLDYFPVHFEEVPSSFMMEVAIYGLPVRMPHWSFGVRYIYQLIQHRMGHSRLFEVVFPGNPGRAYLARNNSLQENTLVVAHVLGHADFSRNNALFRRSQEQVGYRIVEQAAAHARQIELAAEKHGYARVEAVLDAALALEAHVDPFSELRREPYPDYVPERPPGTQAAESRFHRRYADLPGAREPSAEPRVRRRSPLPPHPERDLLWFIAHYAPDLEDFERDIFLAVREESFYFYPVFACQIMNEGWASYWHARLLREADFLPQNEYLDALKTHSDVVRPHAAEQQSALSINPYHLGFAMWDRLVEAHGLEKAFRIRTEEDDFSFIRNWLSADMAEELKLFRYQASTDGSVRVLDADLAELHEAILAPRYNFGAPAVSVSHVRPDGTLELSHDHELDGRGLDVTRAERVLGYISRVWRRPVELLTADAQGGTQLLRRGATDGAAGSP